MLRYVASRLVQGFFVVVGAIAISFLLVNLTGNPADVIGGGYLPPEARRELAASFGYDDPLLVRLGDYMTGALRADFGVSIRTREPATAIVLAALPNTAILVACAMALALAIAVPVSLFSALRRDSRVDRHVRTTLLLAGSLPDFWVALVVILVASVQLGLLPSVGFTGVDSLIAPSFALALPLVPVLVRLLRGTLLDVAEQDFVAGLRGKGFSDRYILVRHGLRNAMVPFTTLVAYQVGGLLGGTFIVEVVFGWPGIGTLLAGAVAIRDIALVQATVVIVAVAYVLLNLAADLLVAAIDPRVRVAAR